MSSEKPSRRFASTAWSISWSFWWRKLAGWIFFDLLAVCCLAVALIHGYNQTLPKGTFEGWLKPVQGVSVSITPPSRENDLEDMHITSSFPSLLERDEVTAILRLSPQPARAMARCGGIKAIRPGDSWRHDGASLAKLAPLGGGDGNGR